MRKDIDNYLYSNLEDITEIEKKYILRQRAKEYSSTIDSENQKTGEEYLLFYISNEKYAIKSKFIKNVILSNQIIPIPFVPEFIKGVINIRGKIYSVINMRKLFNLDSQEVISKNKIIIVNNDSMEFGLLIDIILGIEVLIFDNENTDKNNLGKYIQTITKDKYIVIDIEKMLNDESLIIK